MDKITIYYLPGENAPASRETIFPSLKRISKLLDGPPFAIRLKLSTGRRVVVMSASGATQAGKEYNFTICPIDDKKSWIDISGPAIIAGRDDKTDDLRTVELTDEEFAEIYKKPYEI